MNLRRKGVTLIELLVAIVMLGMISIGFASVDLFARYQVISSDRRSQILNEASIAVEAIAQKVRHSEGWIDQKPFIIYDPNGDGVGDDVGGAVGKRLDVRINNDDPLSIGRDFCRFEIEISQTQGQKLRFYPNFTQNSNSYQTISGKITEFNLTAIDPSNSDPIRPYALKIHVKTAYDPDAAPTYPDNPDAAIDTVVVCPSASMG